MEIGISFQELMHYNDAETRHWHEFLEQHPMRLTSKSALRAQKTFAVLSSTSSLWNCATRSVCSELRPHHMSNSPPAPSTRFSVSAILLAKKLDSILYGRPTPI
jgi:hypothetical protein